MRAAAPETESIVQRIFGGVLQSEVICAACCHISTAYDPFLDISLDIGAPPLPPPPMLKPPAHGAHRCWSPLHTSSLCCCIPCFSCQRPLLWASPISCLRRQYSRTT